MIIMGMNYQSKRRRKMRKTVRRKREKRKRRRLKRNQLGLVLRKLHVM